MMKEITINEVDINSFEKYLFVDIRSKIVYENGHIPDAISLPEPFELEQLENMILSLMLQITSKPNF